MEPTQEVLLEMPEQPGPVAPPAGPAAASVAAPPQLKPIDRAQGLLRAVIVEELVAPDHKVRAIWDLTGQLNLSGFL
jgi:hypothetical protein